MKTTSTVPSLSSDLVRISFSLFHSLPISNLVHQPTVIQGTADVGTKLSKEELAQTIDFCSKAFIEHTGDQLNPLFAKVRAIKEAQASSGEGVEAATKARDLHLTEEEQVVLNHINARRALHAPESIGTSDFTSDIVCGMKLRMKTGGLGLDKVDMAGKANEQWAMPLTV